MMLLRIDGYFSVFISFFALYGRNLEKTLQKHLVQMYKLKLLLGVLLVLGFLPWIARGLERLIPD